MTTLEQAKSSALWCAHSCWEEDDSLLPDDEKLLVRAIEMVNEKHVGGNDPSQFEYAAKQYAIRVLEVANNNIQELLREKYNGRGTDISQRLTRVSYFITACISHPNFDDFLNSQPGNNVTSIG